jgi:hypothetical protein
LFDIAIPEAAIRRAQNHKIMTRPAAPAAKRNKVLAHDKFGQEPEPPAHSHGFIDIQQSVSASARLDFATGDFANAGNVGKC